MGRKKRKKQKPLVQLVLPVTPPRGQSEVGRLMDQFRLEQESAQRALYGFAQVGKHEFIEARMTRMGIIQEELGNLVGEDEAGRLVVEQMNASAEQSPKEST